MALKPTSPRKVIKALIKLGFQIVRQKGSHTVLKHSNGRITVVPIHPGEEIGRGLLTKIIRDTGLSKEEFLRTLEEA